MMNLNKEPKICPRCRHEHISVMYNSPVADVWAVLQCDKCLYMWRTSEPARRSDPEHYPEKFRMTEQDMAHAEPIPAIPPLKTKVS
ncbi:non-oxidative hydroxyarylic acid decarboxylases subunit D [Pectobacterium sp. B1J-3]|uniref:non-oxidative hydroxyarylic acid decarboxylases subunit D n=1 Tax=Pectobacterium sp. B1J-3 TaxID=3385371 RepID=UPI003905BE09